MGYMDWGKDIAVGGYRPLGGKVVGGATGALVGAGLGYAADIGVDKSGLMAPGSSSNSGGKKPGNGKPGKGGSGSSATPWYKSCMFIGFMILLVIGAIVAAVFLMGGGSDEDGEDGMEEP